MTSDDRDTFERSFRRMATSLRLRVTAPQLTEMMETYFKLLSDSSLADVLAAGKACLETSRQFPKPTDWLHALPQATTSNGGTVTPDIRTMDVDEQRDYARAERLHYEDDPCGCLTCQLAGTTDLPLRFVPDFTTEQWTTRVFDSVRNRVVVAGHWAHGEELARWHTARAAFYACVPRSSPMGRALLVLVPDISYEREPGQEG